jgi:hypothetical protein
MDQNKKNLELALPELIKKIEKLFEEDGAEISAKQLDSFLLAMQQMPEFSSDPNDKKSMAQALEDRREDHAPLPDLRARGHFSIPEKENDETNPGDTGSIYLRMHPNRTVVSGDQHLTTIVFDSDGMEFNTKRDTEGVSGPVIIDQDQYDIFKAQLETYKKLFAQVLASKIAGVDPNLNGWL